jgi:hypothetical protein
MPARLRRRGSWGCRTRQRQSVALHPLGATGMNPAREVARPRLRGRGTRSWQQRQRLKPLNVLVTCSHHSPPGQRPLRSHMIIRALWSAGRSVALHPLGATGIGGGAACVTERAVWSSPSPSFAPRCVMSGLRRGGLRRCRKTTSGAQVYPAQRVADRSGAYSASRTRESVNRSTVEEFFRTAEPGSRGCAAAPPRDVDRIAATARGNAPPSLALDHDASYGGQAPPSLAFIIRELWRAGSTSART